MRRVNYTLWLATAACIFSISLDAHAQDLYASTEVLQSRGDHSPDYGFQIVERYLPDEAPLGYTSIAISKLTAPMVAGRTYHLRYTLKAEPFPTKSYTLAPIVLPSTGMDLPYEYFLPKGEQQQAGELKDLAVAKTSRKAKKGVFETTILPQANYRYLTFLVPEENLAGIRLEPRVDIAITGIYLDVEPIAPQYINIAALPWVDLQPVKRSRAVSSLVIEHPAGEPATAPTDADLAILALPKASKKHDRTRKQHETLLEVPSRQVRLGVYDNKRVDGDIVTIIVNGRLVVQNHELTKAPVYFDVQLADGENSLVLHAENLGRVVPNTAAILFETPDGSAQEVVLSSNLEMSEYVQIQVP